jgi:CDGSH-type Zn-finger protein
METIYRELNHRKLRQAKVPLYVDGLADDGLLDWCWNRGGGIMSEVVIQLRENGPIVVKGPVTIVDHLGQVFDLTSDKKNVALCRCGHSSRRPFCDGTHKDCGFVAVETASPPPPVDRQAWFRRTIAVATSRTLIIAAVPD